MSIANASPTVWSTEILEALDTLLVYGAPSIINTDYEGDIANVGDSVRIITLGDVSVKPYVKGVNLDPPQQLTDAQLTLLVDQADYFNFALDDIDARQSAPNLLAEAARRAAYGMRKVVDSFIAAKYIDAATANLIGTDGAPITGFNVLNTKMHDNLVDLGTKLDTTDTPEDGRFAVLPPWAVSYLEKDPRYTSFGTDPNRAVLMDGMQTNPNGLIGRSAGFNIYKSNQVPNTAGAKYKIIAGHSDAWSRAMQLIKTVAYNPEGQFSDALKGLQVYGAKVLRPANLAVLTATDS